MDKAYINATHRRSALYQQLEAAKARVFEIEQDLSSVDAFIAEWRRYAETESNEIAPYAAGASHQTPEGVVAGSNRLLKLVSRPRNPSKEVIGNHVAKILREHGSPIPRAALFVALEEDGVTLSGTNPEMVLSTMMWRMQERFKRTKAGYWFVNEPPVDDVLESRVDDKREHEDDSAWAI